MEKLFSERGQAKICVPLTGEGIPALQAELEYVLDLPADLFEWRVDCYFGDPLEALSFIRERIGGRPLLCTVRTEKEGGKAALSPKEYEKLVSSLLEEGGFALVDLELSSGEDRVERLVKLAREKGILTVISRHDFQSTPSENEIHETLLRMKALGADLPKFAAMPHTPGDVLALLSATWRAFQEIGPVITMSMGDLGKISRASAGIFGSLVTFAAGKRASAPGQMNAEDLKAILEDLAPRA